MSLDSGMIADEDWMLSIRSNISFLSLTKFEELRDPQNRLASRVGKWKPTGGSPPVNKFPVKTCYIIFPLLVEAGFNFPIFNKEIVNGNSFHCTLETRFLL